MKAKFLVLALLFFGNLFSQKCHTEIILNGEIDSKNLIHLYKNENFATLWLKTENQSVYGIIGKNNQRILIKFTSITKNLANPTEYFVVGKSNVKGNSCHFRGKIIIKKIEEIFNARLGVNEARNEKNAGLFTGKLETKFYIDKDNFIKYNDIERYSDSYFNNGFTGTWKSYLSNKTAQCNWGDYRVPNSDCDFDIGTGEFSVSKKYQKNGWLVKPKLYWWK
jgi:hypothetical protein